MPDFLHLTQNHKRANIKILKQCWQGINETDIFHNIMPVYF